MLDLVARIDFLLDDGDGLREREARTVENLVRLLDAAARFERDARTRNADAVEADGFRRMAVDNRVRHDVLRELRHAADHGVAADLDELMDARHAADDGTVLDDGMACEAREVRHDDVVADDAIVRDMRERHEQAVITDARLFAFARRAVDGRALADCRAVADEDVALLALEFQILRLLADRGALENLAVFADLRPARDDNVRADLRALADFDILADDRVRPDLDVLRDPRPRSDDGGLVDVCKYLVFCTHLLQLLTIL